MTRSNTSTESGRALALGTAVVLLASRPVGAGEAPGPDLTAPLARLSARLDAERVRRNLPSLSVAVVHGDDVVLRRAFGQADPDRGTPATPEHVYRAGSITKVFVATALMQLVEKGVLRLDDPLARHVPEYRVRSRFPTRPRRRCGSSHPTPRACPGTRRSTSG